MISHGKDIKIFTGNANPKLAQEICNLMGAKLGESEVGKFSDGEVFVSLYETVRGSDVFVVQSTCTPVNTNLMELLVMIDALKRASAGRITAVIPYFGYARQDRKAKSRDPISAKLVANMLTSAGADRVLTMDLHASQIQGFFDIPVDHLLGNPTFVNYYLEKFPEDKFNHDDFADVCLLAALVDDSQTHMDLCCKSTGTGYGAYIGRNNNEIIVVVLILGEFIQIVINEGGVAQQVIHRDVEEALDLCGVQVHSQDTVSAGSGDHIGNQLSGDGIAALGLTILTGVAEVGNDGGNTAGGSTAASVDHNQQLHQMVVDRLAGGLN